MAGPLTITRVDTFDVRFPTARAHDGSDAMNPDPDYSAAYVVLRTGDPSLEGHGFAFTIGEGTEICVAAAIRTLGTHLDRAGLEDAFAGHGGLLAEPHRHQPPALAGPREGRHPPRDRGGPERGLGPVRQDPGRARMAAARGHDARAARRARRLPLPHRRPDTGPGAGHPASSRAGQGRRASRTSSRPATRRTRPPQAGWATTTTRSAGCARKRSTMGSMPSS